MYQLLPHHINIEDAEMQIGKIENEMSVIFNNVTNQLLQMLDIERITFDPQNHLREMLSYYSLSTKPFL